MQDITDFFIAENRVDGIPEEDYKKADYVVSALDAIARLTYHSIYVIDYYKKEFLYVSANPLFLCGIPPLEVRDMGYAFYFNHVPENEISLLLEINRAGFEFFNRTPVEDRLNLTISYDFHIQDRKKKTLINHRLTPILLAGNGNIWLAACVVSLSSHKEPGNIEASKAGTMERWTYSCEGRRWKKNENIILTEREKDILFFTSQGLTMQQISDRLFITVSTIKYHKDQLFSKLGVKHISEAISVAANNKLI